MACTGLDQEGLYRLPGVKSKIEDAKSRYDRGEWWAGREREGRQVELQGVR